MPKGNRKVVIFESINCSVFRLVIMPVSYGTPMFVCYVAYIYWHCEGSGVMGKTGDELWRLLKTKANRKENCCLFGFDF